MIYINNTSRHKRSKSAFPQNRDKFLAKKLRILKEKGDFLGPNVSEKGVISKLENADMSSFIILSEWAGVSTSSIPQMQPYLATLHAEGMQPECQTGRLRCL